MAATRSRSGSKAKRSGGKAMSKSKSGSKSKTASKRGSPKSKTGSRTASKSASSSAKKKRGAGKRDLLKTPTGNFFAHRDGEGQFTEMDEMGRSLAADRRKKAKTKVSSGYGDRGDR